MSKKDKKNKASFASHFINTKKATPEDKKKDRKSNFIAALMGRK